MISFIFFEKKKLDQPEEEKKSKVYPKKRDHCAKDDKRNIENGLIQVSLPKKKSYRLLSSKLKKIVWKKKTKKKKI